MSRIIIKERNERLIPNFSDVPFFCPRCEELRNVDPDNATGLNTPHESLIFHSFQMCSVCYRLTKENPELVEANKKLFKERLVEKEKKIEEEVKAHRFRVWIVGDYSKYVESITGAAFFGHNTGGKHKMKSLVKKEEAEKMVGVIKTKNIECGFDEENA